MNDPNVKSVEPSEACQPGQHRDVRGLGFAHMRIGQVVDRPIYQQGWGQPVQPAERSHRKSNHGRRRRGETSNRHVRFAPELLHRRVRQAEPMAPVFVSFKCPDKCRQSLGKGAARIFDGADNRLGQHQFFGSRRQWFLHNQVAQFQPLQVQSLHRFHDAGLLQFRQVDNERLQSPLDFRAQFVDAFLSARVIAADKTSNANRFSEVNERFAAVAFLRGISQSDRDNFQTELAAVSMFQLKRHPCRAGLHGFELRIIVSHAFGKNADGAALFEDFEAGFERVQHRPHGSCVVLEPVDGNDAALFEQPGQRFEAKQLHGGDEVDLTWHQRADDKRVGD